MAKVKSKKQVKKLISPFKNYWNRNNLIIFIAGLVLVIIGFLFMAQDPWDSTLSLSISPIILLIAYIVVFPLSILYKKKKTSLNNVSSEN
ncbi:MAG: hypothetical protein KDC88_15355 [Ignavibacteriae bacterium]|nr:hypothetical protein [Ignavibacteriota bacterium]MCB9210251.1 hypothetical protein [Ignavibacteriales bacterium]MCB9219046.1 hypothetical protein [Ignavibacteriales bacterium]MCB9259629.1 hypothetical protein [Ignavibacteriales bacterium]